MKKIFVVSIAVILAGVSFTVVLDSCNTDKMGNICDCSDCETKESDGLNCYCAADSSHSITCKFGTYDYALCKCECDSGWTGRFCDSAIPLPDPIQITVGMSATMTPSFGSPYLFTAGTFEVKVKKSANGQGADTLVLDGFNSIDEFITFSIYLELEKLSGPVTLPINRVEVANTVLPFHGDASKPGIPFVSPVPPDPESKMVIEYFQESPLQIKGTFNCKLEEFGNSNNTVDVKDGKFGYK